MRIKDNDKDREEETKQIEVLGVENKDVDAADLGIDADTLTDENTGKRVEGIWMTRVVDSYVH